MPNTTLLIMPFTTSLEVHGGLHLRPERSLIHADENNGHQVAAKYAHCGKKPAKRGIEITPDQNLGATTRAIGSTAIISIADNCSVAFISPISAVIEEPARLGEQ